MGGLCKLKARRRSIARRMWIATDDQQGRPSIENESLFHGKAKASVACFDAARLSFGEARENRPSTRREVPDEVRCQTVQHPFDQVGEDEIGLAAPELGMMEPARFERE